jgi:adenine-specific DNA-methyltransferase
VAYLEDKIEQVQDKALRDVLLAEVKNLKKGKKFGLVFEDHVPELVPVYSAPIRPSSTVALKDGDLRETFRVKYIKDGLAIVHKDIDGSEAVYPVAQLVVVQRFGEVIYPALIPVATVENGGERPFHTLIEADNYHALQLLEYLYGGQVDCIYIDPPYNTGAKDWKYNNNYVDVNDSWRHSKWLSMMKKRLLLAKQLLKPTGILIITIDDYEIHHLRCLLETSPLSELSNLGIACIRSNPGGRATLNGMAVNHEYAIFLGRSPESQLGRMPRTEGQIARYNHIDERGAFEWVNFRKHGADSSRDDRPKQYYPIYVCGQKIKVPQMTWDQGTKMWVDIEEPNANELPVWPINPRGGEKVWSWGSDRVKDNLSEFEARLVPNKGVQIYKKERVPLDEGRLPGTWWDSTFYSANESGTKFLQKIFSGESPFDFPKSLYAVIDCLKAAGLAINKQALVLDFFAGSGTVLNGVNLLNAADGGSRQCILVTNNEVSAEEMKALKEQGFMPGDAEYEKHGICQSVTYPRSKYSILGKRDDGTLLDGDYLTGRTISKEKRRTFKQIGFINTEQLISTARKKELAGLLDGIPQSKITKDMAYFVDETCTASILFDDTCAYAYLDALDDMTHVETFYLVTANNALFKRLKDSITELLGPLQVSEEEKRSLSAGFEANLAYFKLDFLDADEVQLGRKFAALLPILWLMAGAKGACPQVDDSPLFFLPEHCPFAVLLDEHCFLPFKQALQARPDITHVFLVTNSEEGFFAMRDELDSGLTVVQLYKNYLDQFKINTEQRGRL